MNAIKKFFSYDFQFYVNPIRIETVDQIFAGIALCAIVLAIAFKVRVRFAKNEISKNFFSRLVRLFATVGILGVVWYGLRYQNVNLFGSHFMFLLLLAIGLVWFGFIAKYWWKHYAMERTAWEKEQLKMKYLAK